MSTPPETPSRLNTGLPDIINTVMFRQIMADTMIQPDRLNMLIHRYLIRNYGVHIPRELSSERGKAYDEIMHSESISWKVFIKALAYINVRQVDIELELRFRDELIKQTVLPSGTMCLRNVIYLTDDFASKQKSGDTKHVGTYLAEMFKKALEDLKIDRDVFDKLMVRYIEITRTPTENRKLATIKGNFNKEFQNDTMTWSVFIKSLVFLGVEGFTYSLALTHASGHITLHQKKVSVFDIG